MENIYHAYKTPITDKFVVIDTRDFSSASHNKTTLENENNAYKLELESIPQEATDEELLTWAKINYPHTDYSVKKEEVQRELVLREQLLEAINNPVN